MFSSTDLSRHGQFDLIHGTHGMPLQNTCKRIQILPSASFQHVDNILEYDHSLQQFDLQDDQGAIRLLLESNHRLTILVA